MIRGIEVTVQGPVDTFGHPNEDLSCPSETHRRPRATCGSVLLVGELEHAFEFGDLKELSYDLIQPGQSHLPLGTIHFLL